MRITIKLFATLQKYLPANATATSAEIDVPEGATVADVLTRLGIPEQEVHMTLIDGRYVAPEERASTRLSPDAALAVWPPVAGG
ncbi:MoaD/ThiS family protein [Thermopetrobacter sp. TC1]|uniref:MoaD/ThiS family protein n=1 Tax=Thermopetrobacter sp. TC1 TaxID=1495045 RepID=UPI00056EAB89|nr:MoaD/ThiS family protein [Thermopetrobacter sp. TC1]